MASQTAHDVTAIATANDHDDDTTSWPLNLDMGARGRKIPTLVEHGKKEEDYNLQELKDYLQNIADPDDPETLTLSKVRAARLHFLGPVVQKPRARKQENVDRNSEDDTEDDDEAEPQAMAFDQMKIASYFMDYRK
ncbi:hypothetical protein FGRMN_642 [Fusarium graminum]|nr:hypothetical protein FGRMN_642 [Fusarium graminum]